MRIKSLLFSLSFIFIVNLGCFLLQPFYHQGRVLAHEISEEPWILINNEDLLKENTDPEPPSLVSFAHRVSKTFMKGENIQLTLVEDQIKKNFNVSKFEAHWSVWKHETAGNQNFEGKSITLKFDTEGIYGVSIAVESNHKLLIEEGDFVIVVGTLPLKSGIKMNGNLVDKEINISRDDFVKFSVDNPNSNYKYIWDLGDGETKAGSETEKLFENTKMPLYVFLRTIDLNNNLFTDNYIKLDSNQPPKFKVNTPPVKIPNDELRMSNIDPVIIGLLVGTVILVIIILYSIFILRSIITKDEFHILGKRKGGKIAKNL